MEKVPAKVWSFNSYLFPRYLHQLVANNARVEYYYFRLLKKYHDFLPQTKLNYHYFFREILKKMR
jgi:hypothetical protein